MATQQTLDGQPALWGKAHLTKFAGASTARVALGIEKDREAYCTDCRQRITVGTDLETENGHRDSCPHWRGRDGYGTCDRCGVTCDAPPLELAGDDLCVDCEVERLDRGEQA